MSSGQAYRERERSGRAGPAAQMHPLELWALEHHPGLEVLHCPGGQRKPPSNLLLPPGVDPTVRRLHVGEIDGGRHRDVGELQGRDLREAGVGVVVPSV